MAKKRNQYHNESLSDLINYYIEHQDSLTNTDAEKALKSLESTFNKFFRGSNSDIDKTLAKSKQLREVYEIISQESEKLRKAMESSVKYTEKLAGNYQVNNEDVVKSLNLIVERDNLNKEYRTKKQKTDKKKDSFLKVIENYVNDTSNSGDTKYSEINSAFTNYNTTKSENDKNILIEKALDVIFSDEKDNKVRDEYKKLTIGLEDTKNALNSLNQTISRSPLASSIDNYSSKPRSNERAAISNATRTSNVSNTIINNTPSVQANARTGTASLVELNKFLALTFDTLKAIGGVLISGANKWIEIEDRVKKVGRSIGLSHEQVRGYQKSIMDNYGSMAAKLGMTIDELTKFQEKYTKSTGRAIQFTKEQVTVMASASKLVGEVATDKIVENMDDFGASTKTAMSYLSLNMARAKASGLDAQKASEAFANNVKLASKFTFSEGINGISKMTLLSQQLKFNMESVANAAEKFQSIEGAISTSANLQMLGGTYAQQFANPLEAMNMAMLNVEGFTQKIIDSVKGKAYFNEKTGQIEMGQLDKMFLRNAAQQLGMSYDELFNMSAQPVKIREIERRLDLTQNFTETEKAFIANKAQFDPESRTFKLTYFDDQGNEQEADVAKLSKAQLKHIQQQSDIDKAIYGDIHSIHGMLQDYLVSEGIQSTSMKEHWSGIKEASGTSVANIVDLPMTMLSGFTKWFTSSDFVGGITAGIVTALSLGKVATTYFGANLMRGATNLVGGSPRQKTGGGGGAKPPKSPINSKFVRGATKLGGALTIATGAYETYKAIDNYSDKKEQILNDKNLTLEEKARAKTSIKRERNEDIGGAVGGTVGALATMGLAAKGGAAIGTLIGGPIGTAVGAIAGLAIGGIGYGVGKLIGSAVGDAVTSDETVEDIREDINEANNPNAQPLVNVENSPILNQNDEEINLAVSHISNSVDSINGYLSVLVSNNNGKKLASGQYNDVDNIVTTNNDNNSVLNKNGFIETSTDSRYLTTIRYNNAVNSINNDVYGTDSRYLTTMHYNNAVNSISSDVYGTDSRYLTTMHYNNAVNSVNSDAIDNNAQYLTTMRYNNAVNSVNNDVYGNNSRYLANGYYLTNNVHYNENSEQLEMSQLNKTLIRREKLENNNVNSNLLNYYNRYGNLDGYYYSNIDTNNIVNDDYNSKSDRYMNGYYYGNINANSRTFDQYNKLNTISSEIVNNDGSFIKPFSLSTK